MRFCLSLVLCCLSFGAGCADPLFLLQEVSLVKGEGDDREERFLWSGCEEISDDRSGPSSPQGKPKLPFSVEHQYSDQSVIVTVIADEKPLATRRYSPEFLATETVDEFTVRLDAETRLHLTYRGSTKCGPVRGPSD